MKRLLLLPSTREVEQAILRLLGRLGVTVDVVVDGDDALLRLTTFTYDIVVIDRVLAAEKFNAIIESLRGGHSPKPVVIVTSTLEEDLDSSVVSLIVPSGYDSSTLVGVILACATDGAAPPAHETSGPLLEL